MGEVKWIKITVDMFDNRKIKAIRKLPEGNNIILIWVMLLSLAGRCNASGMIFLTENIPYTNKMLADELGFEESVICVALDTLERFGMISRDENLLICVNNWAEYQSAEGLEKIREYERKRKAKQRKRNMEIECKETDDVSGNCPGHVRDMSMDASGSYSLSYSNICNLNNLLDTYSKDYYYIINNKELLNTIKSWMEYKDQRKPKQSNHYTEIGLNRFIKNIIENSEKYGVEAVVHVINDSIANNYQGVAWGSLEKGRGKHERERKPERKTAYHDSIFGQGD